MKALILVDIQNDFLPTGALPVPKGDEVIAVANRLSPQYELVVATQDWHPADHGSFASQHPGKKPGDIVDLNGLPQILWPNHCVQNTQGAEFAPGFDRSRIAAVFHKGIDRGIDSYSGFFDNGHRRSTGMCEWLKARGVDEVHIAGLATDYCVKFSALDAVAAGFRTHVILEGSRGVELVPGDIEKAVKDMQAAGVKVEATS